MKNIFDPTWERVRSFTGWRKYKDLADFLGLTKGTISGCKARGTFPREYAEELSRKFGKSIDWILTGIGKARANRQRALFLFRRFQIVLLAHRRLDYPACVPFGPEPFHEPHWERNR